MSVFNRIVPAIPSTPHAVRVGSESSSADPSLYVVLEPGSTTHCQLLHKTPVEVITFGLRLATVIGARTIVSVTAALTEGGNAVTLGAPVVYGPNGTTVSTELSGGRRDTSHRIRFVVSLDDGNVLIVWVPVRVVR